MKKLIKVGHLKKQTYTRHLLKFMTANCYFYHGCSCCFYFANSQAPLSSQQLIFPVRHIDACQIYSILSLYDSEMEKNKIWVQEIYGDTLRISAVAD